MSDNERQPHDETANEDGDDLTPDDLRPGEDNPLAEPLDEDEASDDLDVLGGKSPEESSEDSSAD